MLVLKMLKITVDVKYSVNDLDNRVENLEDFQNSVVGTDKPVNDTYAT